MLKYLLLFLTFLVSCSSQKNENQYQYNQASTEPPIYYFKNPRVVERSNFSNTTPNWVRRDEEWYEEDGRTFAVGRVSGTMENDRDQLCLYAESMAKRRILNSLGQSLRYGLNIRGKNVDFGSEERSSKEDLPGIQSHGCYVEKKAIQANLVDQDMIYEVYARVSIETDKLKKLSEDSEK